MASRTHRLWVLAENDGEAVEVRRLLEAAGERLVLSRQGWGARWDTLEEGCRRALLEFRHSHPDAEVLGVELAGPNEVGARNIDHHRYKDEDRSHPLSALEQVAQIVGVPLDRRQQLVAANDRGYIPAMLALGASQAEVADVRRQDRKAQGIDEETERIAQRDLEGLQRRGGRVFVECSINPTSAHADALFGKADESLLAGPSEWSYEGGRHRELAAMDWPEQHWSGGAPERGYFGIEAPSEASQGRLKAWFWR
ncbi:MAG: hypothetical protein H6509_15710 [Bryobacterales bacterium]|nr:hypothetical protein [Bryobacterales bacterium]